MIKPPKKPFDGYKWRWATLTPTEGLNEPPIYLGVLRAMRASEGSPRSSEQFKEALEKIEQETRGRVTTTAHLVRPTTGRNLLRNSGQYWTALGLLSPERSRTIELTNFGSRVADGAISRQEFAATVVRTLTLPNLAMDPNRENWADWYAADLTIKPLELILEVVELLKEGHGSDHGYLASKELYLVVIPLAGDKRGAREIAEAVYEYRTGVLSVLGWPDCTPEANDKRMAKEFLVFLKHYGFLVEHDEETEGFFAGETQGLLDGYGQVETPLEAPAPAPHAGPTRVRRPEPASRPPLPPPPKLDTLDATALFSGTQTRTYTSRQRVNSDRYRVEVMRSWRETCLITGESTPDVLDAAHIIPVDAQGVSLAQNSLCRRTDVHRLFDRGHIRLREDGRVIYSDTLRVKPKLRIASGYCCLPGVCFTGGNPLEIQLLLTYAI